MELFDPRCREEKTTRLDAVAQLRDVGERLKHVLTRYDCLATRLTDGRLPIPDLIGRIDWLNLQLAATADQLQELIVLERQSSRTVPFRRRPAKPRETPQPFVVQHAVAGRA